MMIEISSHTRYADQTFQGARLEQTVVAGSEFHDCAFVRCSFAGATLRNCRFVRCTFQDCDLGLAQVPGSVFSDARFEDCKVIGVNWTEADWPAVRLGKPPAFLRCALNHSTFIGLNLHGIRMENCAAVDVDFREADLSGADFGGTDLANSLFAQTNLTETDLSRARNYAIAPAQNTLKGAKFSLPEAMSLLYNLDIVLVD
jgi:fluoroquinolone resistance protein